MKSPAVIAIAFTIALSAQPALAAPTWQSVFKDAQTQYGMGDFRSAEKSFRDAISRAQSAGIGDNTQLQMIRGLADTLMAEGKLAEAEAQYVRTMQMIEKAHGASSPMVAEVCERIAGIAFLTNRNADADSYYIRAVDIRRKGKPVDNVAVAADLNNLAASAIYQNKDADAEKYIAEATTAMADEKKIGDQGVNVHILRTKAMLLEKQGKIKEAEEALKKSLSIAETCTFENDSLLAASFNELGRFYIKQKNYAEAQSALDSAVQIADQLKFGAEHPILETSLANLAAAYMDDNKYEKAESPLLRAIAINEKFGDMGKESLRGNLTDYAKLLEATHRTKQAGEIQERLNKLIATPNSTKTE
jgi:tetratricopeptide (TPR) repeat protein